MNSWLDFEKRFRELAPQLQRLYRLDGSWGYSGETWRIAGAGRSSAVSNFEELARLAGKTLKEIAPNLTFLNDNPLYNWYRALRHFRVFAFQTQIASDMDENNNVLGHTFMGTLSDFCSASADMCLRLHTEFPIPESDLTSEYLQKIAKNTSEANVVAERSDGRLAQANQQAAEMSRQLAENGRESKKQGIFIKRTTILLILLAFLAIIIAILGWPYYQTLLK